MSSSKSDSSNLSSWHRASSSKSDSSNLSPWHRALEEKLAEFNKRKIRLPEDVQDEASFRFYFESLGRSIKEKHYTKLLVQLHLGPINSFAIAVDTLERLTPPCSLAMLIYGGVYMAIEVRVPACIVIHLETDENEHDRPRVALVCSSSVSWSFLADYTPLFHKLAPYSIASHMIPPSMLPCSEFSPHI